MNQLSSTKSKYYSPLIGAALVAASLFQFSFPVFAAGTAPGTVLRNTATGSYEDDAGNPYTIESNTVDVTVAKVAGITNQPSGFTFENTTDPANTELSTGDRATFEFTITNVGNDASNIYIPPLQQIVTNGLSRDTSSSDDADNFVIQVSPALAPGATHNFTPIPASGSITADQRPTANGDGIVENVPANGTVVVRVTSTVTATAANAPIDVLLGNTGSNLDPNAPVADTQNQPDAADGGDPNDPNDPEQIRDVRTLDATTPVVTGPVVGGQKEASALQQQFLGSNPLAMARVEKTRGDIEDNGGDTDTPGNLGDDIIPYSLELEVLSTTPNSFFTPTDLEGRNYTPATGGNPANPNTATFAGITDITNLILISDAIPANTELATPLTATGDWTPVYSIETGLPDEIAWTATAPTTPQELEAVTRIGWVKDAGGTGPITRGTTVDAATGGFTFNVRTTGLTTTGGTIANIAQVFGSTVGGADIFDESGDQDPSNFNGTAVGPTEDDPLSTGIADPDNHDIDTDNNNNLNGTDAPSLGGEDNVVTINNAVIDGLLIGPSAQPTATGNVFGISPADNNHDFQNLGVSDFPDDAKHNAGTTYDPGVVTFTNTLNNPTGNVLSGVLLQPINPEFNNGIFDNGNVDDDTIPVNTKVRIIRGTQTSVYDYVDDPGNPGNLIFLFNGPESTSPVVVPDLNPNDSLDYTVEVDLPNTGLSTDDAINGGFPIPIVAFIDQDTGLSGTPDGTDDINLTINQVYTGFVKISKQVRVLQPDGVTPRVGPAPGNLGMGFNDPDSQKTPAPGDILEYRVIYRNISEPQVGSNTNAVLNGVNVLIDENGTIDNFDGADNGNNWALDNNGDNDLDTINVQSSAEDTNPSSTITFYTGEAASIDSMTTLSVEDETVTGYRSTVTNLAPAGAEDVTDPAINNNPNAGDFTFTFQRKVDEFDGLAQEGLNTN